MSRYNIDMKTEMKIEMKKIRNKLKVHTLTQEEKEVLRNTLEHLKVLAKAQKS